MNKLIERARQSKLNQVKPISQPEKIVNLSRTAYSQVRSFRLDDASWNNLSTLLEKINSQSSRKISASRLIKALIQIGVESKEEKVIQALKEIAI